MKKALLVLSVFIGFAIGASAQCTPDTVSAHYPSGTYVYPASLDTIMAGQAFSGTVTLKVPDSLPYTILTYSVTGYVDSIRIDSIAGEPTGITSQSNPSVGTWLHKGQFACAIFTGTTNAPTNNYPLTIYGRACGHINLPSLLGGGTFDTCTSYQFNRTYPYSLTVKNPSGVSEISAGVNLNIYPNPNQGNFTVTISSDSRVTGTMSVIDDLGRVVNTQNLDVTATKQIALELGNVAPGAYALVISSNTGRAVKQFIVK